MNVTIEHKFIYKPWLALYQRRWWQSADPRTLWHRQNREETVAMHEPWLQAKSPPTAQTVDSPIYLPLKSSKTQRIYSLFLTLKGQSFVLSNYLTTFLPNTQNYRFEHQHTKNWSPKKLATNYISIATIIYINELLYEIVYTLTTIVNITYYVHYCILYFIIVPQFPMLLYGCVCPPVINEYIVYVMLCVEYVCTLF